MDSIIQKSRFIVFEGLDGAGKSTLIARLQVFLTTAQVNSLLTREPGGTDLGDELRQIILRTDGPSPCPRAELLLYQAIRAQHVEQKIQPALAQPNQWVLCDRFTASSIAFQGGGRQVSTHDIEWLNKFATSGLQPDLTVLLDLTEVESRRRRESRTQSTGESLDRIEVENAAFHSRVRESFLQQASQSPETWLVLDAGKTSEELQNLLVKELRRRGWV